MSHVLSLQPQILNHPWYQKWECGQISQEGLQSYASEYYWQVANFPRYLSRLHSEIDSLEHRQVILKNLSDEENVSAPHVSLWLDFAEALGVDREAIQNGKPSPATQELIEKFRSLVAAGPASGLGAILAYEAQVPEVARFKSQALKNHYFKGDAVAKGTRFFELHAQADVWHSDELNRVLKSMSEADQKTAQNAANEACSALWKFLDAMPA